MASSVVPSSIAGCSIALDAMGAHKAPKPEIDGALQAARQFGVRVLLVGREEIIRAELSRHSYSGLSIEVIHASEQITMHDKAAQAVRAKRDSPMRVGLRLVREGRAAGFVAAGHTGGARATGEIGLGGLPRVGRPAFAAGVANDAGPAAHNRGG